MAEPLHHDGAWWLRGSDGGWLRWSEERHAWELPPAAPGLEPALPESPTAAQLPPPAPRPFQSLAGPARVVTVLLALGIAVDLLSIVSGGFEINLLQRLEDGERVTDAEIDADDLRVQLVGLLQGLVYLATAVAFIVWFYRAHRNLAALGAQEVRHASGWAIGAWFIPVFGLIRPKSMANDVWRASDPALPAPVTRGRWKEVSLPALFLGWWSAFVASNLVYTGSRVAYDSADSAAALKDAAGGYLAADVLSLLAGVAALVVVRRVTARQDARAQALAAAAGYPAAG